MVNNVKISAVIVAAGSGERAKLNKNKMLFLSGGKTVIEKTVGVFLSDENIDEIILAVRAEEKTEIDGLFSTLGKVKTVIGGKTRSASVFNALKACSGEIVLIHDGARPNVTRLLIERCISGVLQNGSAVAAIPVCDTLAEIADGKITETRRGLYSLQTPQAFYLADILAAYESADGESFSDDSGLFLACRSAPFTVDGDAANKKLTYQSDFEPQAEKKILCGTGFDLHRLVIGRALILGGVLIPHDKGLLGHSDADVLTHAVMDAMLSALALGDIGKHFPDTDERYKGISSMKLLSSVKELVAESGYKVSNLSAAILAEKPKLGKFVPSIAKSLSTALDISAERVGITCTTLEGIGTVGREEGIAAQAYVLLEKI